MLALSGFFGKRFLFDMEVLKLNESEFDSMIYAVAAGLYEKSQSPERYIYSDKLMYGINKFAAAELCAPGADAAKAFLLLQNYSLIGRINDAQETAFLQKAHVCLKQCSSKQNWNRLLESYREIGEAYRFYCIEQVKSDNKTFLKLSRNKDTAILPDRADAYISYIRTYREEKKAARAAADGICRFYVKGSDAPPVEVAVPKTEKYRLAWKSRGAGGNRSV